MLKQSKTDDPRFAVLQQEIDQFRQSHIPDRTVSLEREAGSPSILAQLIEINAIGAEVSVGALDWKPAGVGTTVKLQLEDGAGISSHSCVITSERLEGVDGKLIIGMRYVSNGEDRISEIDRRRYSRWKCPDQFHPTGIAANPTRSNDFLYFRVSDISGDGLGLLTSPRNRYLSKGLTFDSVISLPTVRQVSVRLCVKNVRMVSVDDRDFLLVGTSIVDTSKLERSAIAQYMLQFGPPEQSSVARATGISGSGQSRPITFAFVNDEETYREVMNLRQLAYRSEGKASCNDELLDQSDLHDARSRIIVCRSHGRVIASARLAFPEYGDRTEHEEFVKWPEDFPRRDQVVEVTRACTHPEYRRGGVFFALLRFIVITAVQAQRPWVVTSATEDLVSLYNWIGLRPCGISFSHASLNGLSHHLLIGNIPAALIGKSVSAGAWYAVWREALTQLDNFQVSSAGTIRLVIYRLIGSVSAGIRSRTKF
jgi:predicted GNAT family N-acyltransferase